MKPLPRMNPLLRQLRRFRDKEDGVVLAEFLILLPLLVWVFMALFIYWDAFRTINQSQKGAYSVADVLSRQKEVDANYINGMQTLMQYLVKNGYEVKIRVTSIKYDENSGRYAVLFSRSPGGRLPALTNISVNNPDFADRIPVMDDQDSVVVVETRLSYVPSINVGVAAQEFSQFIVTRPRLEQRQVCFKGMSCPSIVRL